MCISVETLYEEAVKRLSRSNKVSDTSNQFSKLSVDAERVEYALSVLYDCNIVPDFNTGEECLKRQNVCVELRNKGNALFQQHKDNEALMMYTQSIANCPFPSEIPASDIFKQLSETDLQFATKKGSDDLAYAYANRSAVLFALDDHKLCLQDIEQVEHLNYPDHLMFKLHMRKAKCLMKLGAGSAAQNSCVDALKMLTFASALSPQRREALEHEIRTMREKCKNMEAESNCVKSKQMCLKDMKLSCGANKRIPCASDCIDIDHSETMGRSVVVTRDVSVGDILLMEEPFTAVLLPHCYYTHCFNCFRRCRALIPCVRCSVVMFCSEACRKESWEKNHCFECYIITSMLSLKMTKLQMLALRVIITASKQHPSLMEFCCWVKSVDEQQGDVGFDDNGQYISKDYRTVYHIVTNTEKRTVTDLFERSLIAGCILELLRNKTSFFNSAAGTNPHQDVEISKLIGGLILRHLQNLPCNAHEISEYLKSEQTDFYELEEIGAAAYATLSLVNHSCDPNVVRIMHNGKNALIVIRPIRKGEQVLDNYGYHYAANDLKERKTSLERQYFFTCHCLACEECWPTYPDLPSKDPMFHCPKCHLGVLGKVRESDISSCSMCQCEASIGMLAREFETSAKDAADAIQMSLKEPNQHILNVLIAHLKWLDCHVQRPWQSYNDCQEAIKHMWFYRSTLAN